MEHFTAKTTSLIHQWSTDTKNELFSLCPLFTLHDSAVDATSLCPSPHTHLTTTTNNNKNHKKQLTSTSHKPQKDSGAMNCCQLMSLSTHPCHLKHYITVLHTCNHLLWLDAMSSPKCKTTTIPPISTPPSGPCGHQNQLPIIRLAQQQQRHR